MYIEQHTWGIAECPKYKFVLISGGSLRGLPLLHIIILYINSCWYVIVRVLVGATAEIEISDLEFEKQVGKGRTGIVYKGQWKSRGLEVAIKTARDINKTEVSVAQ